MIVSIGIDISKSKLDIYHAGRVKTLSNDREAINKYFEAVPRESRIVMEATSKYHRLAHRALVELGFAVMVINPYQSKHFSKALNVLCKTDGVDAKMLAVFGEKMEFIPTPLMSQTEEELQDLSRYLADLKKVKQDLESRLRESEGFITDSLKQPLDSLDKAIKETERELKKKVGAEEELQEKLELLCSIPGIGLTTGIMLLSNLRELGSLNKNAIAALSGLAPMNHDSGQMRGKRRIRGGRAGIRSQLYMPIVGAATQHNKRLKAFYDKLVKAGKEKKVALTACMRKLVVWANAILATKTPWQQNMT